MRLMVEKVKEVEGAYARGLSQKVVDFCFNTRLCIRNSMKFIWHFDIHHINIVCVEPVKSFGIKFIKSKY